MTYFLDTNIFLHFLIEDDENKRAHDDCRALFQRIKNREISALTASLVFAEIVWVLQSYYSFSKQDIIVALKTLLSNGITFDDRTDIMRALALYQDYSVKFTDCLIASHQGIQQNILTLISYDKEFDKLNIKRLEPKELTK